VVEGAGNRDRRGGYPDGITYRGDTHHRSPNRGKVLRPRAHHTLVRRQGRPVHVLCVEPHKHVAACDGQKEQSHRELSRTGSERLGNHGRTQRVLSRARATRGVPSSRQEPGRRRADLPAYPAGGGLSTPKRPLGPAGSASGSSPVCIADATRESPSAAAALQLGNAAQSPKAASARMAVRAAQGGTSKRASTRTPRSATRAPTWGSPGRAVSRGRSSPRSSSPRAASRKRPSSLASFGLGDQSLLLQPGPLALFWPNPTARRSSAAPTASGIRTG